MVAFVHCNGTCDNTKPEVPITRVSPHAPVQSCSTAATEHVPSGCLGYGDCAKVCPSGAIYNNNNGVALR